MTDETKAESNGRGLARLIQPRDFDHAMTIAEKLSSSDLVPQAYRGKAANIVIAWDMGATLGLDPMTALQSIAVVGGKPVLYGEAPLAVVQASGFLEDIEEEVTGEGWDMIARCTLKRKGAKSAVTRTFSMAQAKTAQVWERDKAGNGKWISLSDRWTYKSFPADMLTYRARGRAMKVAFADILKGVGIREAEIETDAPPAGGEVIEMERGGEDGNEFMPKQKAPEPGAPVVMEGGPGATVISGAPGAHIPAPPVAEPAQDKPKAPRAKKDPAPKPEPVLEAPGAAEKPAQQSTAPLPDLSGPGKEGPTASGAVGAGDPVLEAQAAEDPAIKERLAEAVAEMEDENAGENGEEVPDVGPEDGPQEFDIAGTHYLTKGITRDQVLLTFSLVPAVDKAKKKGTARAIRERLFPEIKDRRDLTKAQAEVFIAALQAELKG